MECERKMPELLSAAAEAAKHGSSSAKQCCVCKQHRDAKIRRGRTCSINKECEAWICGSCDVTNKGHNASTGPDGVLGPGPIECTRCRRFGCRKCLLASVYGDSGDPKMCLWESGFESWCADCEEIVCDDCSPYCSCGNGRVCEDHLECPACGRKYSSFSWERLNSNDY